METLLHVKRLQPNTRNCLTCSRQDRHRKKKRKNTFDYKADEALRNVINNIVSFDGINIEVVGSWVWVDGNTFTYREELKKLGFKWSKNRKKWHFSTEPSGKWHKKKMSFEDIQRKYGSEKVKTSNVSRIA
mgnify:CR=1 FL=1